MTIDPNGVASFFVVRQPRESAYTAVCPACGAVEDSRHSVEYVDAKRLRLHDGEYQTELYGKHDPHLIVTCGQCGFWWECEVWIP